MGGGKKQPFGHGCQREDGQERRGGFGGAEPGATPWRVDADRRRLAQVAVAYPPDEHQDEEYVAEDFLFSELLRIFEQALDLNSRKNSDAEELGRSISGIVGIPLMLTGSTGQQ